MSQGAPIHARAKGRHTVLSFDGRVSDHPVHEPARERGATNPGRVPGVG
jgi:hypothetical protein